MDHHRRPRTRRGLRQTLLGVLALLVAATGLLVTPLPAKADEATKVLLLLDVSGSMNERISSGGTKFAAAQRAVKRVADAVPAGTQVGLRVYGSEIAEPKEQNPKACTDTKLVLPIGPLNRRPAVPRRRLLRGQGRDPDRVLAGEGGRRPRPVRQAGADPDLRRRGELRRRPLPGRPPSWPRPGWTCSSTPSGSRSTARPARSCSASPRPATATTTTPTTPPTWRTRSAGSPSGRCGPSRPAVRRWRAPSTRPVRRRSGSASTRTPTTPATPPATTGSPGRPGRP